MVRSRAWWVGGALAAIGHTAALAAPVCVPNPQITLLGTMGGPVLHAERSQPATAIRVGEATYLFDVGYGTLGRLTEANIPLKNIKAVFITHNHLDHNADLGPLIAFSWQMNRRTPLRIFGPPGTKAVVEAALKTFERDIEIFNSEMVRGAPELGRTILVEEMTVDGQPFDDGDIQVRAAENTHYDGMIEGAPAKGRDRSFSYRIEASGHSIVVTGDTGRSDAVAALAAGADFLVSEVIDLEAMKSYIDASFPGTDATFRAEVMRHMVVSHISMSDLGSLAKRAKVGTLILTHYVPGGSPDFDSGKFVEGMRKTFDGPVIAGQDLMTIPVGPNSCSAR